MKICHNTFIGHLVGRAPVGSKSNEDRSSRLCRRSGFVVAKVQAGLGTVLCKSEIRNPKSEFRTKPDLTGTGFGFRFSGFSRFSGFGIRVSPASGRGGFTMVEIAICLAIIGFALIAIIGALPIGMNTQRDNREETLINQDATVLLEAIRGGARGLDNLTNYVYAITNNWGVWSAGGVLLAENVTGYTYAGSTVSINGSPFVPTTPQIPLTNGLNIIGLLSTPEYTI